LCYMQGFSLALVGSAVAFQAAHVAPGAHHRTAGSAPAMGLLNRFRTLRKVEGPAQIVVGDTFPIDVDVERITYNCTANGACAVVAAGSELLSNGTTVLFGMPGAFTPTCNDKHLPGIINSVPMFEAANVSKVAVVTTNDKFVMDAWTGAMIECSGGDPNLNGVNMLADADGDLVKALGMATDLGFGLGVRSKRFALVLEEGTAKYVAVDDGDIALENTTAENVLEFLDPKPLAVTDAGTMTESQQGALAALAVAAAAVAYYYTTLPPPGA